MIIIINGVLVEGTSGTTVSMREANYYDDSDFYATYYDSQFKEVKTGSTRYGGGSGYVEIDAPPMLINMYSKYLRVKDKINERIAYFAASRGTGLTYTQYRRIQVALELHRCGDYMAAIYRLLHTKKFRSTFRESLATQVRVWAKQKNPPQPMPLSKKQLEYI